ncbi:unnamed protein product [Chrysodeixis includens]|uniref:Uncharacterized protein n=1 Tax=Chrysodeixis includens TaxID=689277 RepID=A0A9P0FVQ5_CHRIL|nr:unnamed protein product [Chrysodeixis includens]
MYGVVVEARGRRARGLRPATGPARDQYAARRRTPSRALSITTRYAAAAAAGRTASEATQTRDHVTHSRFAHRHTWRRTSTDTAALSILPALLIKCCQSTLVLCTTHSVNTGSSSVNSI